MPTTAGGKQTNDVLVWDSTVCPTPRWTLLGNAETHPTHRSMFRVAAPCEKVTIPNWKGQTDH